MDGHLGEKNKAQMKKWRAMTFTAEQRLNSLTPANLFMHRRA